MKPLDVENRPKCPYCEYDNPESLGRDSKPFQFRWKCLNRGCEISFTTHHQKDKNTGIEVVHYVIQNPIGEGRRTQKNLSYEDFRVLAMENYSIKNTQKAINSAIYYIERYSNLFNDKQFESIRKFYKRIVKE